MAETGNILIRLAASFRQLAKSMSLLGVRTTRAAYGFHQLRLAGAGMKAREGDYTMLASLAGEDRMRQIGLGKSPRKV